LTIFSASILSGFGGKDFDGEHSGRTDGKDKYSDPDEAFTFFGGHIEVKSMYRGKSPRKLYVRGVKSSRARPGYHVACDPHRPFGGRNMQNKKESL
jgi:hypothetical protein